MRKRRNGGCGKTAINSVLVLVLLAAALAGLFGPARADASPIHYRLWLAEPYDHPEQPGVPWCYFYYIYYYCDGTLSIVYPWGASRNQTGLDCCALTCSALGSNGQYGGPLSQTHTGNSSNVGVAKSWGLGVAYVTCINTIVLCD